VSYLVDYSVLKTQAERIGIQHIDRRQGVLNIRFHGESRVDPARLMALVGGTPGAQFTPAGVLRLPLDGPGGPAGVLERLRECLAALASA
jgi:transcription-repair coupling factor (superfamily II helicase)